MLRRLIGSIFEAALDRVAVKSAPGPRRKKPAKPPEFIRIRPDDDDARYVGMLPDGSQFFLTNPFVPASREDPGCEFVVLYLFTAEGVLRDAKIARLGPRKDLAEGAIGAAVETFLTKLGKFRRRTIKISPFSVRRHGVEFGLIASPPKDPYDADDHWWVEAQPGNYMAFTPPWRGEYDT